MAGLFGTGYTADQLRQTGAGQGHGAVIPDDSAQADPPGKAWSG